MAKNRYLNTEIWYDNWFVTLNKDEKLLWIYLLSNPFTNVAGIYRIPVSYIAGDTGINIKDCKSIMEKFENDKKIIYRDGLLVLKNFIKNQNCTGNMKLGILSIIKSTEKWVIEFIYDSIPNEIIESLPEAFPKPLKAFESLPEALESPSDNINLNLNSNLNLNNIIVESCDSTPPENIESLKAEPETSQPETAPGPKKEKYPEDSMPVVFAKMMLEDIRKSDPKAKTDIQRWAKDFDYLNRLDGREWSEIEKVWKWVSSDDFWSKNIKCPSKLRKDKEGNLTRFSLLKEQMERKNNYGNAAKSKFKSDDELRREISEKGHFSFIKETNSPDGAGRALKS